MSVASASQESDKEVRVTWIYHLPKEELTQYLKNAGLDADGTLDELRQRFSKYLREGKTASTPDTSKSSPTPNSTERIALLDRARKWNVHFDGTGDAIAFIERLNELTTAYEIPEDNVLVALPELFRGEALLWLRNYRERWNTWGQFLTQFQGFFYPRGHQEKIAEQVIARRQYDKEPARTFVNKLQTLMRRNTRMSEEEKLSRIYANLQTKYKFYIRPGDFKSLDELLTLTDQFEVLEYGQVQENKLQPTEPRNIRRTAHEGRQTEARGTNLCVANQYNRNTCCWKCGQEGHRRTECRNRGILFCSFCGKKDARSVDCSCHQGNGR